jgi:hypothetical protein
LKRYFVSIASSSQSKPNTHEETANIMPNQAEEHVEEVAENSSERASDVAHEEQEQEQEVEGGQETWSMWL